MPPTAAAEEPAAAVLLDVDGTLVDTNHLHVLAWQRAFRGEGIELPAWELHRQIGKGGDRYVAAVAGEEAERRCGEALRAAHGERYGELIREARCLPGARELIATLKERGVAVVLASSGDAEEVDHYLDLLDARTLVDGWTTSADVEATKPAPDLLSAALALVPERPALLVGDSIWDCVAGAHAEIPVLGLLSGGFGAASLWAAGARAVYRDASELLEALDDAPIAAHASG